MATITSTTNSSVQLKVAAATPAQAPAKPGSTQSLDSSAVKVQISDKARQALASPQEKAVMATSNLEKQAAKLAEKAASKDISDSERQKLSSALQSINGAIKGLGGNQVSIDRKQDNGTTAKSTALATAAENTSRKNESAQAALSNLAKVYGSGTGTVNGRLNLLA